MNITDDKKLQLLTPGIAKLQTRRLMDKASCRVPTLSTNKLNFPSVAPTEADLKGVLSRDMYD